MSAPGARLPRSLWLSLLWLGIKLALLLLVLDATDTIVLYQNY
jgi:hypothetical protein